MSRYYATLSRGEAVRAVAHAARPALLLAFAACFVAGVWLGRWSVLFETRARRRHLDAAVEKIVEGVLVCPETDKRFPIKEGIPSML